MTIAMNEEKLQLASEIPLDGPREEFQELRVGTIADPNDFAASLNDESETGYFETQVRFRVWQPKGMDFPRIRIAHRIPRYKRIELSELCSLLSDLPDLRTLKSISLLDERHPDELAAFRAGNTDSDAFSIGADRHGNVVLYQAEEIGKTRKAVCNVYGRLLRERFSAFAECFDLWNADQPLIVSPQKVIKDGRSAWSFLSEHLINADDTTTGLVLVEMNPVLGCLWGKAFAEHLRNVPPELRGPAYRKHKVIAEYCLKRIPEALSCLASAKNGPQIADCLNSQVL